MPDILQDFPIRVPPQCVYDAVSQPAMLDRWWTLACAGEPAAGSEYAFDFGPDYQWRGVVTRATPGVAFEWRMTEADDDWRGTTVGFELSPSGTGTQVRFAHRGWRETNPHYRTTSHCWALYLRLLRRLLESGEAVSYADRLDA